MSKFWVVENSDELSLSEAVNSDNNDMKNLLKRKWKEINGAESAQ